jgi:hypothetical protein
MSARWLNAQNADGRVAPAISRSFESQNQTRPLADSN